MTYRLLHPSLARLARATGRLERIVLDRAGLNDEHDRARLERARKAAALARWGRPDAGLVLLVGDSHTGSPHWSELLGRPVACRSIGGEFVDEAAGRVGDYLDGRPRTVVVWTGANDVRAGSAADAVLGRYDRLMRALRDRAPAAAVAVVSLPPMGPPEIDWAARNAIVARVNAGLTPLAARFGAAFADVHAPLADPSGALDATLSDDGVHLTDDGLVRVAGVLRRTLGALAGAAP